MTKHATTIADLANRLGREVSDYGTFSGGHEVIIHDNGQALTLDGGIAVELESDAVAVRSAYADELADEIDYAWMGGCTEEYGTWRGDKATAIAAGADAVDASRDGDVWRYHADEVDADVIVSDDELAELGAALLDGHSTSEVYSIWCAGNGQIVDAE